jgi:hypothetical protein
MPVMETTKCNHQRLRGRLSLAKVKVCWLIWLEQFHRTGRQGFVWRDYIDLLLE